MKHYFIIRFDDLSYEKQMKIKNQLSELYGKKKFMEIENACSKFFAEVEVILHE